MPAAFIPVGQLCLDLLRLEDGFDVLKGLAHGEQTDHDGNVVDAAHEVKIVLGGEADIAGHAVDAHAGHQNADAAADQPLLHVLVRHLHYLKEEGRL